MILIKKLKIKELWKYHIVDPQGAERVEGPSIMVNDVEEDEEEPEDVLKVKIWTFYGIF